MSSHIMDKKKIEKIMLENNIDKSNKNLAAIASQELNLPIKYVKELITNHVKPLESVKILCHSDSKSLYFKNHYHG